MEILNIIETLRSYSEDVVAFTLDGAFAHAVSEAVELLVKQGERIAELEEKSRWIPVTERLPKEHDSIFARFYGAISWNPGMFLTTSDDVIAEVTYEDGSRCTKVMRTQDGKWNLGYAPGAKDVTRWKPLPEPPKEDT